MARGDDGLRPNAGTVAGAQAEKDIIGEVVSLRQVGNVVEEILAQFIDSGPEIAIEIAVDIDGRQVVARQ